MSALNLRQWAESCRLREPVESGLLKIVRLNENEDVRAFAQLCHDLVLDRPVSFTLTERIKLYRRWLAGGQPCLLATHDGLGNVVAASIVLPLTTAAFDAFWLEGLDALDIGPEHLVSPDNPQQPQYFLIDMLARNKHFINRMAVADRNTFRGIGFRAMLYHLSLFYRSGEAVEPVLLCSTFTPQLIELLRAIGFERRVGQGDSEAPIFCADFRRRNLFSTDALGLLDGVAEVIQDYVKARLEPQPKPSIGMASERPTTN
jgi:hypothetical protein